MTDTAVAAASSRQAGPLNADRFAVRFAFVIAILMLMWTLFGTWQDARYGTPVAEAVMGTDFAVFHGAAVLTLEGDGAISYDRELLGEKLAETTGIAGSAPGYGHPPFFGLLLTPFALLRFEYAYILFVGASLVALAFAITRVGGVRRSHAMALALLSVPGWETIRLGQMGIWVSALLFAIYLAMRNDRLFLAGALVGLLAFKPLYAVGIGLWWLLNWRKFRTAIAGAAASVAALSLIGFLVPGGWAGFFSVRFLDGVHRSGFSVLEMWRSLIPITGVALAAWIVSAAGIIYVFWRATRKYEDRLAVVFSLAVILGLLVSLRVGWYDWVLLIVPGVLLWKEVPEGRPGLVSAAAVLLPVAALSWLLAKIFEALSGVYIQIAPWFLAGVCWWWLTECIEPSSVDRAGIKSEPLATKGASSS